MGKTVYHYSENPLPTLTNIKQKKTIDMKPSGFWVSDCDAGDGWAEWCNGESWGGDRLKCKSEIILDMSEILHLSSPNDLEKFHDDYSKKYMPHFSTRWIDWRPVAEKFKGILISPYQWGCRLDGRVSSWYYGWDCASGCIWDVSAIKKTPR